MSAPAATRVQPALLFAGTEARLGNDRSECEDRVGGAGRRFAVADGASQGSYSHIWAGMLVDAFCAAGRRGDRRPDAWLDVARRRWRRWADDMSGRDLPWFTRHALQTGAFAAFAGIIFPHRSRTGWTAVSCGDACVFLVRGDELIRSFPVSAAHAFTTAPPLVGSSPNGGRERFEILQGTTRPGDRFYLATDALAHWFLTGHECGGTPWRHLDGVSSHDGLERFVAAERASGALRNDDIALLTIGLPA